MSFVDEKAYRLKIKETFSSIENKFEEVDPDLAEVELGQGTLTIQNPKGKIILSTQPSVQQLWLAAASLGRALHFNFDAASNEWRDDKGQGLELRSYLAQIIDQSYGLKIQF